MALPLAYLAVRSLGAPSEAWELFFRLRTAQILWRSVLLVLVVTGGTLIIGVSLAWLTARTDMPMRRLLSVLVALPLVIPTYVGGFLAISALGPRGLVQGMLEPLGVSRLPEIYGLPGASATLILLSYPIRLSHRQGRADANGPQPGRVRAPSRARHDQHVLQADCSRSFVPR